MPKSSEMHPIVESLREKVTLPSGKRKLGAVSRLSEHLGVSRESVRRWLSGEWKPGEAQLARIKREVLRGKVKLGAKKPGPKLN